MRPVGKDDPELDRELPVEALDTPARDEVEVGDDADVDADEPCVEGTLATREEAPDREGDTSDTADMPDDAAGEGLVETGGKDAPELAGEEVSELKPPVVTEAISVPELSEIPVVLEKAVELTGLDEEVERGDEVPPKAHPLAMGILGP